MTEDDRKTICFDFDGTLCTNTFGDYESAVPFPWAIDRVNELARAGHRIIVLTARGSATGIDWEDVTRGQLERWGVSYESLHFGKPSADVYVDDRAVHTDAWRVSDLVRPPGFARSVTAPDGELPAVLSPERSAVVEIARTFGGRLHAARAHAERSVTLARSAGIRGVASVPATQDALVAAVAAAGDGGEGDDLVVTVAHVDTTHAALVDTWHPETGGGLHVSCRRLSETVAGLHGFVETVTEGGPLLAAALDGRPGGWPLLEDPRDGVLDALGGQLCLLQGETLTVSPPAGSRTVAALTLHGLARGRGLSVTERPLTREDVDHAEELAVIAMPFCLLPVATVDGRALRTDRLAAMLSGWSTAIGHDIGRQTAGLLGAHAARLDALGVPA